MMKPLLYVLAAINAGSAGCYGFLWVAAVHTAGLPPAGDVRLAFDLAAAKALVGAVAAACCAIAARFTED